jgi:hypothetical protein
MIGLSISTLGVIDLNWLMAFLGLRNVFGRCSFDLTSIDFVYFLLRCIFERRIGSHFVSVNLLGDLKTVKDSVEF